MKPTTLAVCCSLVLTAASVPAFAQDHPDLSGVWTLDVKASDSIDAMLELQGASRLERRMAARAVITLTIRHGGDRLHIEIDGGRRSGVEDLILDGEPHPGATPAGEEITVRAFWSEDGREVVSVAEVRLDDGNLPAELEVRRGLDASGTTLVQVVKLRPGGSAEITARRIFRRSS